MDGSGDQIGRPAPSLRQSTQIGALAGVNLLLTTLNQWYVIATLGPSREADALLAASVMPQMLIAVIMTPVATVLAPLLAVASPDRFAAAAWTFFLGLGIVFGAFCVLLSAMAQLWVPWTVPGFDPTTTALTVRLLSIQAIGMVFAALSTVVRSTYEARARFVVIEASDFVASCLALAVLAWTLPRLGVAGAALALCVRPALQTLFLVRGLGRPRLPDWTSPIVFEAWRRLRPVLLGSAYLRTDLLVDRFFASMSPTGSLALLYTAQQMHTAAQNIIGKALVAPLVPALARGSSLADWAGIRRMVIRRIGFLLGLGIAALAVIAGAGRQLLTIVFGASRFESSEITELWVLTLALGGVLLARSPWNVVATAFYAAGKTRLPTLINSAGYTIGLVLRGIFFHLWGVLGLALAISVQFALTTIVVSYSLFNHHLVGSSPEQSGRGPGG